MNNITKLSELKQGETCVVQSVTLQAGLRQRLRDLGLCPGNDVVCAYIAPSGSPIAFWVKGALIALRREDCAQIRGIYCCG